MVGRLIHADARRFLFACSTPTSLKPQIGQMVCVTPAAGYQIYGLVVNILILSDDLTRRLATASDISESVLSDSQSRIPAGKTVDVLVIGYSQDGQIYHTLPPYPPESLEQIILCSLEEIAAFTAKSTAYFRLVLEQSQVLPICDIVSYHLLHAHLAHSAAGRTGWISQTYENLLSLLSALDYGLLVSVSEAIAQRIPDQNFS